MPLLPITHAWWAALAAVASVNIVAWLLSARSHALDEPGMHARARSHRRIQLALSAGYVLGCAFRSFFPVFDVARTCLVDSFASSVIVGRSVATVAELCFAAQWALLLREASHAHGHRWGLAGAKAILPMIVAAEACSWYSVLTLSNIGHVMEETLWGAAAAILVANLAWACRGASKALRSRVALGCSLGAGYVAYMAMVDVPMYLGRWLSDQAAGKHYLGLAQGAADAASRWRVDPSWSVWHTEALWMGLYFSVAVWLSIAIARLPIFEKPSGDPA